MNKKKITVSIVFLLVLLGGIISYISMKGSARSIPKPDAWKQAMAQQPSHDGQGGTAPQSQASEAQAEAPEEEVETPTVEIPPDKQQMIGVKTVDVAVRPLQKVIRTVGMIEYDERRLATVNTKFEGWIEKLYVDYAGRYVKKGEPLAEIYSPELLATQQEFINTLKWTKSKIQNPKSEIGDLLSRDAEAILEAARQRLKLWDISDEQIRGIEQTGKPIRTMTIYSPVSGYIIQKTALQGMRVMPGEKLFDVADLSTVWIISDIYEYELPLIKAGQRARITLSYFPAKEFFSAIDYVYPVLAGDTRTAKVRFSIPNPGGQLKPQMFTNVEIKIDLGKRLAIPDDAVIDTGTRQIVYVDKGEGNFEPREVMLGIRAEDLREVVMGLKAGEKVAAAATFLVDSEAQLKGVKPLGGNKH